MEQHYHILCETKEICQRLKPFLNKHGFVDYDKEPRYADNKSILIINNEYIEISTKVAISNSIGIMYVEEGDNLNVCAKLAKYMINKNEHLRKSINSETPT